MKKSSYYDSRKIFWIPKNFGKTTLFQQFLGMLIDFENFCYSETLLYQNLVRVYFYKNSV